MGREIRMVPPNFEPPMQDCKHSPWAGGCDYAKRNGGKCIHPHRDETFKEAAKEWKEGFAAWERGERPSYFNAELLEAYKESEYWEDNPTPDPEYYHPEWVEPATWFVVYETVSEGTPVTPAFATKAELVDYLVANGDYWDQQRGDGGWNRENAESFVSRGFAMSGMMNTADGIFRGPRDQ